MRTWLTASKKKNCTYLEIVDLGSESFEQLTLEIMKVLTSITTLAATTAMSEMMFMARMILRIM